MKIACPRCREKGGDTVGDNLTVYANGGYCHACGYRLNKRELDDYRQSLMQDKPQRRDSGAEIALIQTFPFGAPHKQLPLNVCTDAGVRYSVDGNGEPDAIYYPYYSDGQIVDYKKRILPKRFCTISGAIAKAEMFGPPVPASQRGLLIIVEGEDDMLAADAMQRQMGKRYVVRSLNNGANEDGVIDPTTKRQLEFITSFKKVVICLDADKPGRATANSLAELIAPRVEVRIMQLPEGYKDAYDLCKQGLAHVWMQCLNDSRKFIPEGIVEGTDINLDDLRVPLAPGFTLPYPILQQKLHGIRKGEITLVCAGTGIGKTTLVRELSYLLTIEHKQTIGNIYLEEQWKKTTQGYIAIDNNVPLPVLRVKPDILTPEQWQASEIKLLKSGRLHFLKHFGSIASDKLMQKIYYMVQALGSDFIVLDHITMVLSGQGTFDERKDIDILMTRLAELVTETGVGVIAVVHLKRISGDGKGFNSGREIALTDLRGSSQLEALSFNVIAAERDQQGSNPDVLLLRLLKNREWGFLGACDRLFYNHQTGRLTVIPNHL